LIKIISKFFRNKDIIKNEITFVHHEPRIFNIGDYLCSPKHYFYFINPINNLYIIGGGIFPSFARKYLKKNNLKKNQVILWGIGESNSKNFIPQKLKMDKGFLQVGIRDILSVEQEYFLPCVSCLHPMLDLNILGKGTVLFLNADIEVTINIDSNFYQKLLDKKNWSIAFNNCTEEQIIDIFQNNQHIITNSYHAAYWGLLSGHNVTLLGYSSKFTSLLKIFNLDDNLLIKITRGDNNSILEVLENIDYLDNSYKLTDAKLVLKEFRNKNINFINKLKEKSIITDFKLIKDVYNAK
jgi:hypothetical protein